MRTGLYNLYIIMNIFSLKSISFIGTYQLLINQRGDYPSDAGEKRAAAYADGPHHGRVDLRGVHVHDPERGCDGELARRRQGDV